MAGDVVRTKKGEKRVIYASNVLQKIKPAINEINKMAQDPEIYKKAGIKKGDFFKLTYTIRGKEQSRVIIFKKIPLSQKSELEPNLACHEKAKVIEVGAEPKNENLESLLELVKLQRMPTSLKATIKQHYQCNGADYVRWNILYANEKAKRSYSAYLTGALENNWAEEYAGQKQAVQMIQSKKEEIRERIKEKGGPGRAQYGGVVIADVMDAGLIIGEVVLPWRDVIVEEIKGGNTEQTSGTTDV